MRKAAAKTDPFGSAPTPAANGNGESKSDKFRRIAKKRVTRVLKEAELLGNLSSPAYAFSEEEVGKVFGTIRESFDRAETGFHRALTRGHKTTAGFDF